LSHSGVEELMLYIKGRRREQADNWRRTRRLFLGIAKTMGGYKGTEEQLWPIEGDRVTGSVTLDKIEKWKERLKELGKWQTKN